jgi:hypothetical protein
LPSFWNSLFGNTQSPKKVSAFKEAGVSGASVVGGYPISREKNPKLVGSRKFVLYEEILANVSIVAAAFRLRNNLLAKPRWSVEAADDSPEAEYAKEIAERIMNEHDSTWQKYIRHAGLFRFMGSACLEWTLFKAEDGTILLKSLENRPMRTIIRYELDEDGDVTGFWQTGDNGQEHFIPRWKTAWLVDDSIDDAIDGMGLLRHCVEPANRLKNYQELETQGYERDFRGTLVGRAPLSAINRAVESGEITEDQAKAAIQSLEHLVTTARKNGSTGSILDSAVYEGTGSTGDGKQISSTAQWGLEVLTGGANGLNEMAKAIERLNYEMARVLGAEALLLGSTNTGSQALATEKTGSLHQTVNSDLKDIAATLRRDLITPILLMNGVDKALVPNLIVEEVSNRDAEAAANVLKSLVAAGASFLPEDPIFNSIRNDMGYESQPEEQLAQLEENELADQERQTREFEATMAQIGNPNPEEVDPNAEA